VAPRLQARLGMSEIADELRQRTMRYGLRVIRFCKALPDDWVAREIGKQLLRAGMGVPGNYWSACRGRSDREFIAKLGVAVDEADEGVLWLTAIIQTGISQNVAAKDLLGEGQELRAILSKSHKTARDNRQRRARHKKAENQIAKSPIHQIYLSPSMISSRASGPGRVRESGSVASGSSTTFNCARKSSRSGSI
jgi:four helix bundle protein